jgi:hypothetical protein
MSCSEDVRKLRNHRNYRLYFFAFEGGAPIGGLFAGWLVAAGGTSLGFVVGGVVSLAAAALGVFWLTRGDAPATQRLRIAAAASSIWRSSMPR